MNNECMQPTIVAIILKHGDDDYSVWRDFTLTDDEQRILTDIFKAHECDGYSVRGTYNELLITEEII